MDPALPSSFLIQEETPIVILSEGCFGDHASKTGIGVIRYGNWPIAGVIDSRHAGKKVSDVTELSCEAPIAASLSELFAQKRAAAQPLPKAMMLGIAPPGGMLTDDYRPFIKEAIEAGLHVINGLHTFLERDNEFASLAKRVGVRLWDVRNPDLYKDNWHPIAQSPVRPEGYPKVITMVGSDCSVGKMHTALELNEALNRKQPSSSAFVATGQTGIMITGDGVPLDRVVSDFMAGYLESLIENTVARSSENPLQKSEMTPPQKNGQRNPRLSWVMVEGQGSLLHPAYSGVTMALMHGSNPEGMILCHKPDRTGIRGPYDIPIPPLPKLIEIYEEAMSWIQPKRSRRTKILGVSLNTQHLSETDARAAVVSCEAETGLPATDPVRYGVDKLVEGLEKAFQGVVA